MHRAIICHFGICEIFDTYGVENEIRALALYGGKHYQVRSGLE